MIRILALVFGFVIISLLIYKLVDYGLTQRAEANETKRQKELKEAEAQKELFENMDEDDL